MTSQKRDVDHHDMLWTKLSDLIRNTMGLNFPLEYRADLMRRITAAAHVFGKSSPEDCAKWLLATPLTRKQIATLASHLTVGETYFYRDKGSFEILQQHILPQLLKEHSQSKQVRIWSAGCSTGEEPYSIAMSLAQLLPLRADWDIHILATDIDPLCLTKAESGVFGEWSFRGCPSGIKERFFKKTSQGQFEIAQSIKSMVRFSPLNLVQDIYPSIDNGLYAMDIIFCRNVLMYFEKSQALRVLQNLSHTLLESGWLFLSTCELPFIEIPELAPIQMFNAIVHKKSQHLPENKLPYRIMDRANRIEPLISRPLIQTVSKKAKSSVAANDCRIKTEATRLYKEGHYEQVIQNLLKDLSENPGDILAITLLVRSYANLGDLKNAQTWCETAIATDKLNTGLYYLYAILLQEQGLDDEAVLALKKSLYLDQTNALSHYSLGNLFRRQKQHKKASKHFQNAMAILETYPQDTVFSGSEGMTAAGLVNIIKASDVLEEPK